MGGYLVAFARGPGGPLRRWPPASAIAVPHFTLPQFEWAPSCTLAPISLVVITEHIGHLIVTENVVGGSS